MKQLRFLRYQLRLRELILPAVCVVLVVILTAAVIVPYVVGR